MPVITDPDWIDPIEETFDVGKPIRSEQGLIFAGNPIAMALGKPGAPRVQGYAIASDNNGLTPVTVSSADTVTVSAGHGPEPGTLVTNSTTYILGYRFTINAYNGSMRFLCSHVSGSGTSSLELRKNGVAIATFTTLQTVADRVVDASVAIGDVFEWHHKNSFSGNTSTISDVLVRASDGYVPRNVYWLASQA